MSFSIEQSFIDIFSKNVHYLAEQKKSFIRESVRTEIVSGKKAWFDRLSGTEAKKRVGQYATKSLNQPNHTRRMLTTNTWDVNHIVSQEDIEKVLTSPVSDYAMMAAESLNRVIDDTFIDVHDAAATIGQEGGSTVTFANDGGTTIAAGGTGLNKAKLDSALQTLLENDVPTDDEKYLLLSPAALMDLFQVEEFINDNYIMAGLNEARMGGNGKGPYGLNLIVSNRLDVTSGVRDCLLYTKSSMILGYLFDIKVSVNPRYDLEGNPFGIDGEIAVGGLRMEGQRMVKIKVKE